MSSANQFPLDITHRILQSLLDFTSLASFTLSCESVHSVFKEHPKSITRAVAYNVVGPALPQALFLLKFDSARTIQDIDLVTEDIDIEPGQTARLERNATVVHLLEDCFSLRHKDRTSATSRLSSVESLRFQNAMYRLWLLSSWFRRDAGSDEEDEEDEEVKEVEQYLSTLSTNEFFEISAVHVFSTTMTRWRRACHFPVADDSASLIWPFPLLSWLHFKLGGDVLDSAFFLSMKVVPVVDFESWVSTILEEQNVRSPSADKNAIVDSIHGENDQCARCLAECGVALWNETNWILLEAEILPDRIVELCKGRLRFTSTTEDLLVLAFAQAHNISTILDDIHNMRSANYATWDKQDWLCLNCVRTILTDHLHLWLLDLRHKYGNPVLEDCWYGYNCRTQVHKISHALKLNHFCEPTRGDE